MMFREVSKILADARSLEVLGHALEEDVSGRFQREQVGDAAPVVLQAEDLGDERVRGVAHYAVSSEHRREIGYGHAEQLQILQVPLLVAGILDQVVARD